MRAEDRRIYISHKCIFRSRGRKNRATSHAIDDKHLQEGFDVGARMLPK